MGGYAIIIMDYLFDISERFYDYIYCKKDLSFTKAVEASAFVLSVMCFLQHMNQGKCFAHSEFNLK